MKEKKIGQKDLQKRGETWGLPHQIKIHTKLTPRCIYRSVLESSFCTTQEKHQNSENSKHRENSS